MRILHRSVVVALLAALCAASQSHVVALGRWEVVKLSSGEEVQIRSIYIDGRVKDHAAGAAHEVTQDLFVARRVYQINDALASEPAKPGRWTWRLGGWISVNKSSGRISELNLPEFDPRNSDVSWYRDYAAYCGTSDDGSAHYMMIFQLDRRKPILKKELYGQSCKAPVWERDPSRVTFQPPGGTQVRFVVHESSAELDAH